MLWVGLDLQCVIVTLPGHTHFLSEKNQIISSHVCLFVCLI